jgi:ubiquinol-cytochrome c reductase cytochrome b subunit
MTDNKPTHAVLQWIDDRSPENSSIWIIFGALCLAVLASQLAAGIALAMHYKPDAEQAIASVEHMLRDVPWSWLFRYRASTGTSLFYLNTFRTLLHGTYRSLREPVRLLARKLSCP